MTYPGLLTQRRGGNPDAIRALQQRLNALGCGLIDPDGKFGPATETAVKLFQTRFTDYDGHALTIDGEVGANTWAVLFGADTVPVVAAPAPDAPEVATMTPGALLMLTALDVARTQIGVMEHPLGSNRGPEVDEYLRSVGLNPEGGHYAWCAAFVYYCYNVAAQKLGRANPVARTAGVMYHWNLAHDEHQVHALCIPKVDAQHDPTLVRPGSIFIMSHGGGTGHTGLVESVRGGNMVTIEGNTNDGGSREGIGVFRRTSRTIASMVGFIDYGGVA